jgi:putative nucleotidyltransferase with HDIG domain
MNQSIRSIFRIVVNYIVLSAAWIYLSDWFVRTYHETMHLPAFIETYKGWAFILVSGLLIFSLLFTELKKRERVYESHLQEKEQLLEQLRQKNEELSQAYDKTILGWSRVLELRSREVKDHSRRVTELSEKLAKYIGMQDSDLPHIRRGAMLHDIGKMAIPDRIIFKEDGLNEEEWAIMRRHPLFGFEMLSEIEYLRPAIDILLCHHEKWNGEGYPFGLAGEQIPIYARIFAVADVWDALVSERPYRGPQSLESVVEYLRSEAGQHFDPEIVAAFLRMVDEDGINFDVFPENERSRMIPITSFNMPPRKQKPPLESDI